SLWRMTCSLLFLFPSGSILFAHSGSILLTINKIPLWSIGTRIAPQPLKNPGISSNSSMVDRYEGIGLYFLSVHLFKFLYGRSVPSPPVISLRFIEVQIPLWSIGTFPPPAPVAQSTLFKFLYGRSVQSVCGLLQRSWLVQIPLWSIGTRPILARSISGDCSNSSMVDRYIIPLAIYHPVLVVQIPLWSIGTWTDFPVIFWSYLFKFLYGRSVPTVMVSWSLACSFKFLYGRSVPIRIECCNNFISGFKFLYGRSVPPTSKL
ncbi:MAG: hypothetical protein PWP41_1136, partial [Moorella sp. (in: firmicutes)]|nr:hypothetical protein [Moorella sp. (in: firmicutes)]